MTYEEAKAFFEECLEDGDCSDDYPECNAMELAISALEKQILKKVTYNKLFKVYECPTCHMRREYRDLSYCGLCGQALDWRDIE